MKFREALSRMLYGRYGADELYNVLFIAEIILLVLGAVFNLLGNALPLLNVLSILFYLSALGLMIWAMYRFFSRNVEKRRRENLVWLRFKSKLNKRNRPALPPDTPTHIFRACPKCRATLRLPRQAGKHKAKCPRCSHTFRVKVK